jgi:hypothetical protein
LVRDANGAVVVAGILSRGSSDCIGLDEYVRLGAAREWLTASVGDELASAEPGCQALGHEGGCFDGVAAWCTTGGDLDAEQCEAGSSCGWSDAASGFRCRGDGEGACGNVTAVGECDDNVALRCEHGELVQEVCATCSRSPQDGRVTCASPRE